MKASQEAFCFSPLIEIVSTGTIEETYDGARMNLKLTHLLTLSFILPATLVAQTKSTIDWNKTFSDTLVNGRFDFGASTIDGTINTARILSTRASLEITHNFTDFLTFNFDGGATFEAGTYDRNAVAGEGPRPTNRLGLNESSLKLNMMNVLSIKAGAINQRVFQAPMLLGSTAFLGSYQELTIGSDNRFFLFAEQAYASNKDLASTLPDNGGDQVLPKFFAEGLGLNLGYNQMRFELQAMHWAYQKLGAGIATESVARGNSATTAGGASGFTGFKYDYQGYATRASLDLPLVLGSVLKLKAQYLLNDKGPKTKNEGKMAELGLNFPTWNNRMEISGRYLKIMPDASPAFYASYDNNREIYELSTAWKSGNSPLELKLSVSHLEEIFQNPYMSDENRVTMGLSTKLNLL